MLFLLKKFFKLSFVIKNLELSFTTFCLGKSAKCFKKSLKKKILNSYNFETRVLLFNVM